MSESFSLLHYPIELLLSNLGDILIICAAASVAYVSGIYKAARAINSGHFDGLTAKVQTTQYAPAVKLDATTNQFTPVINPDSGRNFYEQKIRVEEASLRVRDIFNAAVAYRVEKHIKQAARLCNDYNPIIFAQLPKTIAPRDLDRLTNLISGDWKSYFSGLYRDTTSVLRTPLLPGQLHHEATVLPVLIKEQGALGDQFRILLLTLNDKGSIDLPPFEDVKFKMQDGSFKHDTASFQDDRYRALQKIQAFLESEDGPAFVKLYSTAIPTGRIIDLNNQKHAPALTAQ